MRSTLHRRPAPLPGGLRALKLHSTGLV